MLRLGAGAPQTRDMFLDDIFLLRLKLLLHMTRDYFQGCDLSSLRRKVVLDNARHVQMESTALGRLDQVGQTYSNGQANEFIDTCFYRCISELAALMELIGLGETLSVQRKKALRNKLEVISHIQRTVDFAELFPGYAN